jgi:hypothetical protein
MKRQACVVAPLVLGIAASSALAAVQNVQEKIVSEPAIGIVRTVSVGSPIHEKSRYFLVEETVTTVTERMKGGRWVFPLTITPDQLLTQVSSSTKFKACTDAGSGPCGLDDDGDGTFDRMAQDEMSMAIKLKKPVRYTTRSETRVQSDARNIKQVILYAGATGDTLRLSYREFSNDMARPAFTEELSIPITKTFPQMVAVKDITLRIHGIDGMGLRYEIVP